MSGPRPDSKADRYDALRRMGRTHDQAVRQVESEFSAPSGPSPLIRMAEDAGFDPTKPDAPKPKSPIVGGLARTAVQGASLGFSDEVRGLAEGAGAMLPGGRSPGEAYAQGRDAERQALGEFRKDHPVLSIGAEIAGGVVSGGALAKAAPAVFGAVKPALTGVQKAAQGARVGAASGAVYGAGSADGGAGSRVGGALLGGTVGGAAGMVLPAAIGAVGKGARKVGDGARAAMARVPPSNVPPGVSPSPLGSLVDDGSEAGALAVLRKLQQAGMSVEDAQSAVQAARAAGVSDVGLVDVGGKPLRTYLDLAAARPGAPQQAIEEFTERRAGSMREMLADAFETVSKIPRQLVRSTRESLVQARKAKANDLFETAFQQAGFVDDPALIAAIETVEEASPKFANKARELARLHKVTPEMLVTEARVPPEIAGQVLRRSAGPGMPVGATDEAFNVLQESIAGARRIPSLRYAHYLKEALDEEITRAQKFAGQGGSGSRLSGLMQLKDQLRGAASQASPKYGEALQEFAGDSDLLRALTRGEQVLHANVAADDLAAWAQAATPGEVEMFRIGGLNAMRSFLQGNAPLAPSITRAWWENPTMRGKMEILLGSPENTGAFLEAVKLTRNKMLTGAAGGNSATFGRQAAEREATEFLGMQPEELVGAVRNPANLLATVARNIKSRLLTKQLEGATPFLTSTGSELDQAMARLLRTQQNATGRAASRVAGQQASGFLPSVLTNRR